jgi:hypothetical protein
VPEQGKMMSDTPRTDAECLLPSGEMDDDVDADFARQLERELDALIERCAEVCEGGEGVIYHTRQQLAAAIRALKGKQ